MFARLTVTITLALLTAASPLVVNKAPITLPLARHFNFSGTKTLLERDQARVKTFKSGTKVRPNAAAASASASSFPVPAVNGAVTYTAEVSHIRVLNYN